jgi:hypothetical protein
MKNVHLLPTIQPSRLIFNSLHKSFSIQKEIDGMYINDGKVNGADFWSLEKASNNGFIPHYIYITSSERIKASDWFIFKDYNTYLFQSIGDTDDTHIKVASDNEYGYGDWNKEYCRKIILTTDPRLIADGVQSIADGLQSTTDDYLEWFVKNPNCEFVNVTKEDNFYHISLYQNKPKQDSNKTHHLDELPNIDKDAALKMHNDSIPKLETLEEAFENIYNSMDYTEMDFTSFKLGAKYMAEKMFSEGEVLDLLKKSHFVEQNIEGWFNQNKKK